MLSIVVSLSPEDVEFFIFKGVIENPASGICGFRGIDEDGSVFVSFVGAVDVDVDVGFVDMLLVEVAALPTELTIVVVPLKASVDAIGKRLSLGDVGCFEGISVRIGYRIQVRFPPTIYSSFQLSRKPFRIDSTSKSKTKKDLFKRRGKVPNNGL